MILTLHLPMFYTAAKVSLEWHMTNIIVDNNVLFEFIWAVTHVWWGVMEVFVIKKCNDIF